MVAKKRATRAKKATPVKVLTPEEQQVSWGTTYTTTCIYIALTFLLIPLAAGSGPVRPASAWLRQAVWEHLLRLAEGGQDLPRLHLHHVQVGADEDACRRQEYEHQWLFQAGRDLPSLFYSWSGVIETICFIIFKSIKSFYLFWRGVWACTGWFFLTGPT